MQSHHLFVQRHHLAAVVDDIVGNGKALRSTGLGGDDGPHLGLKQAAAEAETRGWRISAEKTEWYLKELAAHGMKVLKPSPALDAGLRKIGDQLTADWLKKAGPEGAAIVP